MTSKPELIRIVAVPSDTDRRIATLDPAGTLPGRGAYVCRAHATGQPDPGCLQLATRKGGLQRALRRAVEIPAELISAGPLESDYEGGAARRESGEPGPSSLILGGAAGRKSGEPSPSSLIFL